MTTQTPARRADARRNRDRLVGAATALFTANGVNASLEEIARQAGVGIGTLYRHFPTRDALVAVVYQHETEALQAAADELSRAFPADEALARWMQRCLDHIATKRGLGESLRTLLRDRPDLLALAKGGFPASLHRMVRAAIDAGLIRADVEVADVMQAMSGLYFAPDTPDWRARSGRVLEILMDGLRTMPPAKDRD